MWGCGGLPFFSWMSGVFPGGIFSVFLWALIILALVYLVIKLFDSIRSQYTGSRDRKDSLEILRTRYARGELNQEEYVRMKESLGQL